MTAPPFPVLQGLVPFFVSATAGTTVYGAFDPLIAIADICKKHSVWMHVDVSLGLGQSCAHAACVAMSAMLALYIPLVAWR